MVEKKILCLGVCAGKGLVEGRVHLASDADLSIPKEKGFVLVCSQTNPSYLILLMKSSGVITETGGIVSHAAIISREIGIPCIVGAKDALSVLKEGQKVLLDASNGVVYDCP